MTKRKGHTAQLRCDPINQDRLVYARMALAEILDGAKVSQGAIFRRAMTLYVQHLEHILGDKPRLAAAEGYQIQHCQQDRVAPWPGMFPQDEVAAMTVFPKWTALVTKYQALKPKLNDKLAAEVAAWGGQPSRYSRRND